jgi:hypothetical protein
MAREVGHKGLTKLHVVRSMHERKALMVDLSDAFIALPGGFGTLPRGFTVLISIAVRAVALTFALFGACVTCQAEHLPFKYLSSLQARWDAAEFVCTATVSDVVSSGGLPVIEGTLVVELHIEAAVDRVFKGNWTPQTITFRSFGLRSPDGILNYIGPPLADFRPNSRYLLFLRNETAPEVVTPVLETAILLPPLGTASQYLSTILPGTSGDKAALAVEMIAAIYAEPPQQRSSADYFGHIGQLLGGVSAAHVFETFYHDADPVLRVVAAQMALGWSPNDRIVHQHASKVLLEVAADSSAAESARADAALKLAEMDVRKARPYAEAIVLNGKDESAREFALRALVRIGTRASAVALVHALSDSVLVNQFLATYALQRIECGTSLDEYAFRRQHEEILAAWESHASRPSTTPPCGAVR